MRALALIVLLMMVNSVFAQEAVRVDVRSHGEHGGRLLQVDDASTLRVSATDDMLAFHTDGGVITHPIDGRLMQVVGGGTAASTAVLVRTESDEIVLRRYDESGQLAGARVLQVGVDDSRPEVAISEIDGSVAYALPSTAQVCFADPRLERTTCRGLFDDADYVLERNIRIAFSDDGRHVAVAAQRHPTTPDMQNLAGNARLFVFDRLGSLQWDTPLPLPSVESIAFGAGRIAVSTFDAYAAGGVARATSIVADQDEVMRISAGGRSIRFVGDELFLIDQAGIQSFSIPDGERQMAMEAPGSTRVVAFDVEEDHAAIVVGSPVLGEDGFAYEDLRLILTSRRSDARSTAEVADVISAFVDVRVDENQNTAAVTLDRSTHVFTLSQ